MGGSLRCWRVEEVGEEGRRARTVRMAEGAGERWGRWGRRIGEGCWGKLGCRACWLGASGWGSGTRDVVGGALERWWVEMER